MTYRKGSNVKREKSVNGKTEQWQRKHLKMTKLKMEPLAKDNSEVEKLKRGNYENGHVLETKPGNEHLEM